MKHTREYSAEELRQVMANAKRLGNDDAYWEALVQFCALSGKDHPEGLTRDFYRIVAAYEEILSEKNGRRTRATRTWQKLARKGVVACLEDWAFQKTSLGLELLVQKGLYELT